MSIIFKSDLSCFFHSGLRLLEFEPLLRVITPGVGDGICDCCDGSDEWQYPQKCRNLCAEQGRARKAPGCRWGVPGLVNSHGNYMENHHAING